MSTKTVIVHGWSDTSESFLPLKNFLVGQGSIVHEIYFADYDSLEDNITFDDVIDGFNDEMIKQKLVDVDQSSTDEINFIVHSTGGLVVRHWINHFYGDRIPTCPVKRIVMLAPANFGSTLAHKGRSFFGRIGKGQKDLANFGEVGEQLLFGLELGSPYLWALAERDLLREAPYFNRNQIQVTVLVGGDKYSGLLRAISKDGTDGVVVIPGTSLDVRKYTLDFCPLRGYHEPYTPLRTTINDGSMDVAFSVLPGLHHSSIVNSEDYTLGNTEHPYHKVLHYTSRALAITNAQQFVAWAAQLRSETEQLYASGAYTRYQQFVFHAIDDFCKPIRDYYLAFGIAAGSRRTAKPQDTRFEETDLTPDERLLSDELERCFTENFHRNCTDASYRQALFDVSKANAVLDKANQQLGHYLVVMWITVPPIDRGISYAIDRNKVVVIYDSNDGKGTLPDNFLFENNTTMIELRVDRKTKYVKISKAD